MMIQKEIRLKNYRKGFHLITNEIIQQLGELPKAGLLHLHLKHTSAGLTINENADPSVRIDFESFMNKIIPENDPAFTHLSEGMDDMPAHIKSSLFGVELTIPITNSMINLGTWQGIYLCEFRNYGGERSIVATISS
ncbi:MAG: secondary thiamine-phosphate synthase enzyme YjbQ [Salinivirgaceae bacterium]|jgi:secondary thiamine-phosphate synthase enzyme